MKKRFMMILSTLLLSCTLLPPALAAPSTQPDLKKSVAAGSRDFSTTSGKRNVQFVTVNLNDSQLEVRPVLAHDQLGKTESLESMAKRNGALAAINGTFFMAYNKGEEKPPWGKIVIDYVEINEGSSGSSIGFNGNSLPVIDRTTELSSEGFQHITSAGPTLVKNGKIVLNPVEERMTDPKLTINSGQRSFIGFTADNRLVMGTVPNVTLAQLAEICRSMGLMSAMNMDGGASSGLYAHGKYITTPGRQLSNALIVVPRKDMPIQVLINGEKVSFPQPPIMIEGRVYVPFRGVFEKMGAAVSWDEQNQLVLAKKGEIEIKLSQSNFAYVNGTPLFLEAKPRTIAGHMMVPIRIVTETVGANVNWDEKSRTVEIEEDMTRTPGK
ncbi:stalk domain-containing protein [Brevibacillus sp. B_LB10_24]|uniref:stalk domain-containing protein n=1 Tax=Brevibacillus sp. B_LB10_24 TaxID=3380645 RepID=UPI0038B79785